MEPGRKDDLFNKPGQKLRFDLIPPRVLRILAAVLTHGAEKYGANNWKLVEDHEERYTGAGLRHWNAHRLGEFLDPESGLPHLGHLLCCVTFILDKLLEAEETHTADLPIVDTLADPHE